MVFRFIAVSGLGLLLTACAAQPPQQQSAQTTEEVPELNLNLPEQDCECVTPEEEADYTFLEKGLAALAEQDYIEAVQNFQRYARLETTEVAQWEASLAIAYVSMLPHSPFFDADEARKSRRDLEKQYKDSFDVHREIMLMRESLETFVVMERHIDDLQNNNALLKEDLKKREEALKRLRDLTLGQSAGAR